MSFEEIKRKTKLQAGKKKPSFQKHITFNILFENL